MAAVDGNEELDIKLESESFRVSSAIRNTIICFLIIFPLLFAFGLTDLFKFSGDPKEIWFQRSGALIVIAALWIELRLSSVSGSITKSEGRKVTGNDFILREELLNRFDVSLARLKRLGLFFAFLGTVIWGYGDIIYLRLF